MLEDQKQQIGNNSTGIQVQGDLVFGTNYNEIKSIFLDLFQLNYPKLQDIAEKTAKDRVYKLLDELNVSFEKHKNEIDIDKFADPCIQYEMQSMAINVARRGDKSNMKILTELLCTVASKDCPELIELISSESLRIVPILSKKHIDYLSLQVLVNEVSIGSQSAAITNHSLSNALLHISDTEKITAGDIQYIACIGALETRSIIFTEITPTILKDVHEFKEKGIEDIKIYCSENNLESILKLIKLIDKCFIGHYQLMAIGRLIGWLNLSRFSNIDVKTLFK